MTAPTNAQPSSGGSKPPNRGPDYAVPTNAQVALTAAAGIYTTTGRRFVASDVTECAEEFLAWLDEKDAEGEK